MNSLLWSDSERPLIHELPRKLLPKIWAGKPPIRFRRKVVVASQTNKNGKISLACVLPYLTHQPLRLALGACISLGALAPYYFEQ